jgi:Flp pilus assembly protein TadG
MCRSEKCFLRLCRKNFLKSKCSLAKTECIKHKTHDFFLTVSFNLKNNLLRLPFLVTESKEDRSGAFMKNIKNCRVSASLFARALRNDKGAVAIMFGLTLVPMLLCVGVAVDYSRATDVRTDLQNATDATVLAVTPLAASLTNDQLLIEARKIFDGNLQTRADGTTVETASIVSISVSDDRKKVEIRTQAQPKTYFMGLAGTDAMTVSAVSSSSVAVLNYEIAIVLDNSGSMLAYTSGMTKLKASQKAAGELMDEFQKKPETSARTKFSITPFSLTVNVGAHNRDALWMDREGRSSIHWQNFDLSESSWKPRSKFEIFDALNERWQGCVEHRPGELGVNDVGILPGDDNSLFVPYLAPDEAVNRGSTSFRFGPSGINQYDSFNNYLNDRGTDMCVGSAVDPVSPPVDTVQSKDYLIAQKRVCKYNKPPPTEQRRSRPWSTTFGPNFKCDVPPVQPLTRDRARLNDTLNAMAPESSSNTNLVEGFTWGFRTLAPNAPFGEAVPYANTDTRKILVFMTDGMNRWGGFNNPNGSTYSPFGYFKDKRLDGIAISSVDQATELMDRKTLEACNNAKRRGIQVFTVAFDTIEARIDAKGLSILRTCATTPEMAYQPKDGPELIEAFKKIANQVRTLRIDK